MDLSGYLSYVSRGKTLITYTSKNLLSGEVMRELDFYYLPNYYLLT